MAFICADIGNEYSQTMHFAAVEIHCFKQPISDVVQNVEK